MKMGERLRSPVGLALAILLTVVGIWLALLSFRLAATNAFPSTSSVVRTVAGNDPEIVLRDALTEFARRQGRVSKGTLNATRQAAVQAPLDARPFLIIGYQQIVAGQMRRGVATLEAGRKLDPRQRGIHALLIERYLRSGRYDEAIAALPVLARLATSARSLIVPALVEMVKAPEARDAARRALQKDPLLERSVLASLARSDIAPDAIFAFASATALRDAAALGDWGPVLVKRLVEQEKFGEAKAVWRRLYRLSDTQSSHLLYDAEFKGKPGSAPFNWTLLASGVGAADIRAGALTVDFYGREGGTLASQLMVLTPGAYRFLFTAEGENPRDGSGLFWTLRCAGGMKAELMRLAAAGLGGKRSFSAVFNVPAGCVAQWLELVGEPGEFPTPANVAIRGLAVRAEAKVQP